MFDGLPDSHLEYTRSGFIRERAGLHPLALALDDALARLDTAERRAVGTDHETLLLEIADDAERLIAAYLRARRGRHLKRRGLNAGEWDADAPNGGALEGDDGASASHWRWWRWADHAYSITEPDGKVAAYASEPYEISDDDIITLSDLVIQHGWSVTIRPDDALHFPGRTMRVTCERDRTAPDAKEDA